MSRFQLILRYVLKDLIYLSSHVDDGRWRYPLSCVNTTLDEKARFSIAFCSGNLINKFKKSQLLFDCLWSIIAILIIDFMGICE